MGEKNRITALLPHLVRDLFNPTNKVQHFFSLIPPLGDHLSQFVHFPVILLIHHHLNDNNHLPDSPKTYIVANVGNYQFFLLCSQSTPAKAYKTGFALFKATQRITPILTLADTYFLAHGICCIMHIEAFKQKY